MVNSSQLSSSSKSLGILWLNEEESEKIADLSFESEGFSAKYEFLQDGIFIVTLKGIARLSDVKNLHENIFKINHMFMLTQKYCVLFVDLKEYIKSDLSAHKYNLKNIRMAFGEYVLCTYIINANKTSKSISKVLNAVTPKKIPLHFCHSLDEALDSSSELMRNFIDQQFNGNPLQNPLIMTSSDYSHLNYNAPDGHFEMTVSLLNGHVGYLSFKGIIKSNDLLMILESYKVLADDVKASNLPFYCITDGSKAGWLHHSTVETLKQVMPSLERRSVLDYHITSPMRRGLLKMLKKITPKHLSPLEFAPDLSSALKMIKVHQNKPPFIKSKFHIPKKRRDMQALILKQRNQIQELEARQDLEVERLSKILTDMIWDEHFKPQLVTPPSNTPYSDLYDLLNLLQEDVHFLIMQFRDEVETRKTAEKIADFANKSKSQFLANMSHELRTPLNSLIGFSNILLKNKNNQFSEKDLTYLERMKSNGLHLLDLVNDILDMSKLESGKVTLKNELFKVTPLVHDLLLHFEPQVQLKGIKMTYNPPLNEVEIELDPTKLKQILINLISNAIKFTFEGEVTVGLETNSSGIPLSIWVKDTGLGISKNKQFIIFDPFSQVEQNLNRQYQGTGLGLSICHSFAKIMGFHLKLDSTLGKGSTFTLFLRPQEGIS